MTVTVFTPTYNRAKLLPTIFASLKSQSVKDFEWVIVDDGSTDDTEKVVAEFTVDDCGFPIVYEKQQNGGKHRAINHGVKLASGRLFFIVDSDDFLTEDAIATVIKWESELPEGKWAGVAGQKGHIIKDEAIGSTFSGEYKDATSAERPLYNIFGDKAEVVYTSVLTEYPFPEFDGEKFITENAVWLAIARDGYKFRWFNKIIYKGEYLECGLTDNYEKLQRNNPLGYLYNYKLRYEVCPTKREKMAAAYHYERIALELGWDKKKIRAQSGISGATFFIARLAKKLFG